MFVNLKGRFPLGTVAGEAERQAVLAEAEAALYELKHPEDGLPMVTEIYRKEDLYSGPLIDEIPDLIINMRDWSYNPIIGTTAELAKEAIIRPPIQEWKELAHTGAHRREGILILNGPDISSADLGEAQMVDVAPTIMNLLDLPSFANWDGKVLQAALCGGKHDVTEDVDTYKKSMKREPTDEVYSEEDEEAVRRRLEDLGYL